jgi:acetyl-CoA acyltransferase
MAYELGAMALSGLLARTGIDPGLVDRLIFGTVIAETSTSNLAREVGLVAGLPKECPAHTVTAACISSNVAISCAVEAISAGSADLVIAGGAETLSDVPIRFRRPVRKRLIQSQKARGPGDYLKLLRGLRLSDLLPEVPALAEFSTGLTMGQNGERLAKRLGITREEQDAFALASHQRAAQAAAAGLLASQIVPASVPPTFVPIASDNGVRGGTTLEQLSRLAPAFDRRFGTVTAGNSSFLTDGAAACLIASEDCAVRLGLTPLARIAAFSFVAMDPLDELLLGPVVSIPPALDAAGLSLQDIGVFEIHEAFAAPVLAVQKLLADEEYCRSRLGRASAVGAIPSAALNAWGGSLSIGHPFGATGARLVTTCARRLHHEGKRYGLVTACAAGALGHALVLERI